MAGIFHFLDWKKENEWYTRIKKGFFSGRTTKGVGRGNPPPPTTKQKPLFFYKWRKFTGKLRIMKMLFYEVRHFSPNFHEFTGS